MRRSRPAFTLIELLVVILIISLISVLAIPTIVPAIAHRQVSEAGRLLQGALVGARDAAIHNNAPSGIRLLPDIQFTGIDPAYNALNVSFPLAYSRIVPIEPAPNYSEGLAIPWVGAWPNVIHNLFYSGPGIPGVSAIWGHTGALMLFEAVTAPNGLPNPPTSWYWNIRVGDKIQLNNAGPWYTVVGPMLQRPDQGNAELFCNVGPAGAAGAPSVNGGEFLFLVNGADDNANGWTDEGWDGVDNNKDTLIDDVGEWEVERWQGAIHTQPTAGLPYTIVRRPAPSSNAREVSLPSQVVIDATTAFTTQERSRLPINPYTGYVDILVYPNGSIVPTTIYSSPSSVTLGGSFLHFWLAERSDIATPVVATPALPIGVISSLAKPTKPYAGPVIQGQYWLVSLNARTGHTVSLETPLFDDPIAPINNVAYDQAFPFRDNMQGVR